MLVNSSTLVPGGGLREWQPGREEIIESVEQGRSVADYLERVLAER
jgi:hypothetical protein